jgi:hypothetical protein
VNCLTILCAFYLDAGVLALQPSPAPPPGYVWVYDPNRTANPYGVVAAGFEFELTPHLSWRVEVRHQSSLATGRDRGENSAGAFVRWRPWAHL